MNAITNADGDDGGREQQRHPALEGEHRPMRHEEDQPELSFEDDAAVGPDEKRALDRVSALSTAQRTYGACEADHDLIPDL